VHVASRKALRTGSVLFSWCPRSPQQPANHVDRPQYASLFAMCIIVIFVGSLWRSGRLLISSWVDYYISLNSEHIYASTPVVTRGKSVLIGGDPKGNNVLYTCGSTVVIRDIKV
jgi:hypothetical protein